MEDRSWRVPQFGPSGPLISLLNNGINEQELNSEKGVFK
jgi:hypothetical protein